MKLIWSCELKMAPLNWFLFLIVNDHNLPWSITTYDILEQTNFSLLTLDKYTREGVAIVKLFPAVIWLRRRHAFQH